VISCALIERIVLTPVCGSLRVELYGDFATIAAMAEGPVLQRSNPDSMAESGLLSVVAGTRNCLNLLFAERCEVLRPAAC